jgi:predicted permease
MRLVRHNPLWAAAIVLSLAIGIGATVTIAAAVHALLLYRIPAPARHQLVELQHFIAGRGVEYNLAYYRNLAEAAANSAQLAAYRPAQAFQTETERLWGQVVTPNYFATLQLQPQSGRLPANDTQILISDPYWRRRFAADPAILGQSIRLNGRLVTITGIAPRSFRGVNAGYLPALWTPFGKVNEMETGVTVFARLQPGISLSQAQTAMNLVLTRLHEDWPLEGVRKLQLEPAGQFLSNFRDLARSLLTLLSALSFFVLLIACANAANLQLARGAARQQELAIRRALGATRASLLRQLTFESLLLGLAGGVAGLALAHILLKLIATFPLPELPTVLDLTIPINWQIAAFALTLTLTATVLSGAVAAWQTTSENPHNSLLRDTLVVAQIALTVVLTVATALLLRSLQNAQQLHPGFHPEQTTFAQFDPVLAGLPQNQIEPLVREFLQIPGSAVTNSVPLTLGGWSTDLGIQPQFVAQYSISSGFFDALKIPVKSGRDFAPAGDHNRVLINEKLAQILFKTESPLGRRIGRKAELEVIGVVANHANFILGEIPEPIIYQPLFQEPVTAPLTLAIRNGPLPHSRIPFFHIRTGNDQLASALFVPRATAAFITAFGAAALLLTAVGLYAMVAFSVARRTRELGIRTALGATPSDIFKTVLRRALLLTTAGLALGLILSYWVSQVLADSVYGITPTDPASYLAAAVIFLAITTLAAAIPARRAATMDPANTLRQE